MGDDQTADRRGGPPAHPPRCAHGRGAARGGCRPRPRHRAGAGQLYQRLRQHESLGRARSTARHQAGIATPAQDYLNFAAFDLTTRSARTCARSCRAWTEAAAAPHRRAAATARRRAAAGSLPSGHRRGRRPRAGALDAHLRLRPGHVRGTIASGSRASARRAAPLPPFPGDDLSPTARAATCACRPARTIPRSPSTRSTTSRASAGTAHCAGRSSGSGAPQRRRARRRRGT